jgi:acid stress-induced BolA-like protein IbaG/YrbA
MNESEIRSRVVDEFGDCELQVEIEGNRVAVHIVSAAFDGQSRVKRQQRVYGVLNDLIDSGEIHAVTMRCQTPEEAGK